MGTWCPRCGAEYVEGWGRCSTCEVELVDERPARSPEHPSTPRPPASREEGDPFIPIWEGPSLEGYPLARSLEAAHIPVDLGEAAEAGRLRIEVPRSYIDEAYGVLDAAGSDGGIQPPAEQDDDPDLWAEPAAAGWPWTTRLAVGLVVVVLVVMLILTTR